MTCAASGRGLQTGLVGAGARERQRLGTDPPVQSRRGDRASATPPPEPERQQQPALGWGPRGSGHSLRACETPTRRLRQDAAHLGGALARGRGQRHVSGNYQRRKGF